MSRQSRGLTLVEMLIAIVLTLMVMTIAVQIFAIVTEAVSNAKGMVEMTDRQRAAYNLLQADLQAHTALTNPWQRTESAVGYLEYIEGNGTDINPMLPSGANGLADLIDPNNAILGDCDDVLMLTVVSRGSPFVGKFGGSTIQSHIAEVVWFVRQTDVDRVIKPLTLYRRVLLVMPGIEVPSMDLKQFYQQYDVSVRRDESGKLVPNTLADLTKPENRFSHQLTANHTGRVLLGSESVIKPFPRDSERFGEDIVLSNCVGFDIKAYDPLAAVYASQDGAVIPGDKGYGGGGGGIGRGAFVDLAYGAAGQSYFSGPPHPKSGLAADADSKGIYDTWSYHYEFDNYDNDGNGKIDEGTDGLDNGGESGIVDDVLERETSPPYPYPLRGLQIKIRCYEPGTRQVQELTVVQEFMPD